jgi:replication factor C small subunit
MNINGFKFEMEETPEVSSHGIWAERYRPTQLGDFVGNNLLKETLKLWIEKKDIPHVFLFGSPGGGKTSLAKLLVKYIPCDSLIINASDENSIDDIRNKVQDFAMTIGMNPLKIIVEDEADRISAEGQCMMRNLMEQYSESTRFILTANYAEKIIPAIKSRCQSFEVKPPSMPIAMSHLIHILDKENIKYSKENVAWIVKSYFPDLRKIINFSQQSSINGELKIARANSMDQDYQTKLIELLKTPRKIDVFTEIRQLIADWQPSNYDQIYKHLFDHVNEYAGNKAAEVILNLADAVYQSTLTPEREIGFVACIYRILKIL